MLKIGILLTDHLAAELEAEFGDYFVQFNQLLKRVDASIETIKFDVIEGDYPSHIDDCDGYLITGSKQSAYLELPWIEGLKKFIQQLDQNKKPLIGICFGHQLIAHTLGGSTEKSDKGWGVGVSQVKLTSGAKWMDDNRKAFSLLVSHQDQVTQIPPTAKVIAANEFCEYAVLQMGEHILSFQGHPEFSKAYLQRLMKRREDVIPEATLAAAVESMKQEVDSDLVAEWMVNFIQQANAKTQVGCE